MIRISIFLFPLFISSYIKSQNLIPNGSFESFTNCPYAQFGFENNNVNSWFGPTFHYGTPDFFHSCSPYPQLRVPSNSVGHEEASSGDTYAGLILCNYETNEANPNYREYLEVQLNQPMTAGVTYNLTFEYSFADNCNISTNAFGVIFSPSPITGQEPPVTDYDTIGVLPDLTVSDPMDNKIGWTNISLNYIATGGEQYMTIGNFLDSSSTLHSFIYNDSTDYLFSYSYVYLDDFSLINPCQRRLGNDTTLCQGENLTLDVTTSNANYLWSDSSTNPTLNITQQGSYWVNVILDNCISTDTIIITEVNCDTTPDIDNSETILQIPNIFTPNNDGINDIFTPTISKGINSMSTIIYNRWGRQIYETDNPLINWDGLNFNEGVYFWVINYINKNRKNTYISGNVTILK